MTFVPYLPNHHTPHLRPSSAAVKRFHLHTVHFIKYFNIVLLTLKLHDSLVIEKIKAAILIRRNFVLKDVIW